MLTQPEAYRLIEAVDRLPGIMIPRVGRWHAWPIAKMQLLWWLLQPDQGSHGAPGSWIRRIARRIPRYSRHLALAVHQRAKLNDAPTSGAVGMLYLPRAHCGRDGRMRDFILGDLVHGDGLAVPSLALEQPWPAGKQRRCSSESAIDLAPYASAAELLAMWHLRTRRIREVTTALDAILDAAAVPIDANARRHKIALALALFEARRALFQRLAARLHLRALVVTYGPGRMAEIAAVKELGIPTVEFQHGVIGSHCPDYAWPADYRGMKRDIPLPDRIAVFGEAFRALILQSGFWQPREILTVGAAAMEAARNRTARTKTLTKSLQLVFMTQATSRSAALAFWRAAAEDKRFLGAGACVVFKIHPEEQSVAAQYQALAEAHPYMFEVADADANPVDLMSASDIVVSYNSMALVEALGLGVPAVSLCGGAIPGGFAASFNLADIAGVMPHVATPGQLADVLQERAASEPQFAQWCAEVRAQGRRFFSDGFSITARNLINEVLACNGTPSARVRS